MPTEGMAFMDGIIDAVPFISVVTKIEVLGYNAPQQHYKLLTDFMNDATVLDLSTLVVDAAIEIRKKHKTKLPDAIIAATALVYDFILITRNTADFKNIDGINILDPYSI